MTSDTPYRNPEVLDILSRENPGLADRLPALLELLDSGAAIPYLAKYRKDRTGGVSEEVLFGLRDRRDVVARLAERRADALRSLVGRGDIGDGLRTRIEKAATLAALDNLIRPFRDDARSPEEKEGEEKFGALASAVLGAQAELSLEDLAQPFVSEERGIPDRDAAVAGAVSVLACRFANDPEVRDRVRRHYESSGRVCSKLLPVGDPHKKYTTFHEFSQPLTKVPSHRLLALLRGGREKVLEVTFEADRDRGVAIVRERFVTEDHPATDLLAAAAERAYDGKLSPEMSRSVLNERKAVADLEVSKVFARNLEQMLLCPPAGRVPVLGVQPGVRRGCKIAVVDEEGKSQRHASIHPFPPQGRKDADKKRDAARKTVGDFCRHHKVSLIGIGSGPGCREVDRFLREVLKEDEALDVKLVTVNEAGAGAYSTSAKAKEEFPKLDPRVRSAVTIARRLQDPLAEMAKMEPRSIGVGPYLRDVNQKLLNRTLGDVVSSCVAKVGVDVNTADEHLLARVPGLTAERAAAIVVRRTEHGPLKSLEELREVPGFDGQALRISAGFLRITGGENPLDATAIHPEAYPLVVLMAEKLGIEPKDLLGNDRALDGLDPEGFAGESYPRPLVLDVFDELRSGGKDPRGEFTPPSFREDLNSLDDLNVGMTLEGVVTNVAAFGAFVDVGVDQEGLVHVSELSDDFVEDPGSVVAVGERVEVRVISIDAERKRLSLSRRTPGAKRPRQGEGTARRPEGRGPPSAGRGTPGARDERKPGSRPPSRSGAGAGGGGRAPGRGGGGRGAGARQGGFRGGGSRGGEGGRKGRGRSEDRGGRPDRAPRIIEQKAQREPEPEIDPGLPEEEKFRLKLERLRKKFEKGS